MTNKTKAFLLIIGLAVCLLIVLITNTQAHQRNINTSIKIDHAVTKRSVINTGIQWIFQTTYKLLKTN